MNRQIVKTSDGSHSIYLEEMDEHYHSKHGAIAESQHIFVKNGLLSIADRLKEVSIFEVGMGTGLNVLTTFLAAKENEIIVDYHSIEAYPVTWDEVEQLNYSAELAIDDELLKTIHTLDWEHKQELSSHFSLTKYKTDLVKFEHQRTYDVIYFDAFAPEKQEEMWSEEIFKSLFNALNTGGMLVTYCVKGVIRRRLQKVGFEIEKLEGPAGGKREMCRAIRK